MKISTQGYGGKKIKEMVKIYTNDPKQRVFRIVMTGHVSRFALLDPAMVSLKGAVGESITAKMTISPNQGNGFDIASVKAKDGKYIQYDIKKIEDKKATSYELTVENTRKVPGRFFDLIIIETDTSPKRHIVIRVSCYLSK